MNIFESGTLFETVQSNAILADGKNFVDCLPKRDLNLIIRDFEKESVIQGSSFNLKAFVERNFELPSLIENKDSSHPELNTYISQLWDVLTREPDSEEEGSSLIALPNPYVVPGGRFREIYYWDSYFTMLGLYVDGKHDLIRSMTENFAWMLRQHGFIPNGNRTYYLGRSQPPFFCYMVELLAEIDGINTFLKYENELKIEYRYWMDQSAPTKHVVTMPNGTLLNRYYDQYNTPRPESWAEDNHLNNQSTSANPELLRNIRSAAESGWDFGSRWFADGKNIETIATTDCVAVDLNSLLFRLEQTLGKISILHGYTEEQSQWEERAERRREAIINYCWCEEGGFFGDYLISRNEVNPRPNLACVAPLFVGLATDAQAKQMAHTLEDKFLRPGGLVTSLIESGQQWDAPNGWAPLQWMAICGLSDYGFDSLALEISSRWTHLNEIVFHRTGKLMEKYNVEDLDAISKGGEYSVQEGFGWTNGILMALRKGFRPKSIHEY